MKKLLITILILFSLIQVCPSYAITTAYTRAGLIGGGAADLDNIDGAGLNHGDFAFVAVDGVIYFYILNSSSGATESSPAVISPNANAGDKRWILQTVTAVSFSTSGSADPTITLKDTDNAAGTAKIYGNSSGGTNNIVMSIGVEDSNGENQEYVQLDGVNKVVNVQKALTVAGVSSGQMPTSVYSADGALNVSVAQAKAGTFFLNTYAGTLVMTLPAAEAGMVVCLRNGQNNNQILQVHSDGTDYLVLPTTGVRNTAANHFAATASPMNQICLVTFDATDWYITSTVGTWAAE